MILYKYCRGWRFQQKKYGFMLWQKLILGVWFGSIGWDWKQIGVWFHAALIVDCKGFFRGCQATLTHTHTTQKKFGFQLISKQSGQKSPTISTDSFLVDPLGYFILKSSWFKGISFNKLEILFRYSLYFLNQIISMVNFIRFLHPTT